MKRRADPSHPRGFTLLEVVVTLTIFGLIVLIVFGAFRLGLHAWDRGEQTREEYSAAEDRHPVDPSAD